MIPMDTSRIALPASGSSSSYSACEPRDGLLAYANGFSLCDIYSSAFVPGDGWQAAPYGGYAHPACRGPLVIRDNDQTLVVYRARSLRDFPRMKGIAALAGLGTPTRRVVLPHLAPDSDEA